MVDRRDFDLMLGKLLFPCCEGIGANGGRHDVLHEGPSEVGGEAVFQPGAAGSIVEKAADVALVRVDAEGDLADRQAVIPHVTLDPLRHAFSARFELGNAVILVVGP